MTTPLLPQPRPLRELIATEHFLKSPNDKSLTELFITLRPQLMSCFGGLGCNPDLSEDLSQELMLTVYQKAWQLRDCTRFRAWLFTIGRHALHRYHRLRAAEADSVDLESVIDPRPAGPPAFEFHRWMTLLESHEREVMVLRFVEE
jgi:DNA-directed RNA polymerase specialized sigma24 family protein